jgi:hypothetical protein
LFFLLFSIFVCTTLLFEIFWSTPAHGADTPPNGGEKRHASFRANSGPVVHASDLIFQGLRFTRWGNFLLLTVLTMPQRKVSRKAENPNDT